MNQFLEKLFMLLFESNFLYSCSSSDDFASGEANVFELTKAEMLWNTVDKNWSKSELKLLENGRAIYKLNCAACRGKGGEGNATIGAPALINSVITKGDINHHVALIKNGRNQMPAFSQALTVEEITNVAIFERNAWGNQDYQVFNKASK